VVVLADKVVQPDSVVPVVKSEAADLRAQPDRVVVN